MRKTVGTVTATSWLGSPSVSRSSPPSLTLCYVRRLHEKDTRASSDQPQTFWLDLLLQLKSGFSHRCVYICLFWTSDLSCLCIFSYRYIRPVDPLKYTERLTGCAVRGFTDCVVKRQTQSSADVFEYVSKQEFWAGFLVGI